MAPWLVSRVGPRTLIVGATLCMGAACGIAAVTGNIDQLVALRLVQGLCGGLLLVGGQAMLFLACPRQHQPLLQALFAVGAVVAPATLAPALQGWLLDTRAWTWIFFAIAPLSLAAAGLILLADTPAGFDLVRRRFDWAGLALAATPLTCLTYGLSQGSRWDWFEEPRLGASLTSGTPAVAERLAMTSAVLMAKGINAVGADQASLRLLFGAFTRQATVIAFDRAFAAVALLFVVAAPGLVAIKIGLNRHARRASAKNLDVRSQTSNGPGRNWPGDIAIAAPSTDAERVAT